MRCTRLQYLGVVGAMSGFCEEFAAQKSVDIEFRHDRVPGSVPPDVSLCLFRVLQEALHNAVRHSGARHFGVHLRGTADVIDLTVRDEGAVRPWPSFRRRTFGYTTAAAAGGECPKVEILSKGWSGRRGSNPRHRAWESRVLPLNYSRGQ